MADEPEIARLRDEVRYWRIDAAARLQMMMSHHSALLCDGEDQEATELRVWHMMPSVAALRDAIAGDLHGCCENCGKPVINGQWALDTEDCGPIHASCDDPTLGHAYHLAAFVFDDGYPDGRVEETLAEAQAVLRQAIDEPANG